jgi:hypothetical protein
VLFCFLLSSSEILCLYLSSSEIFWNLLCSSVFIWLILSYSEIFCLKPKRNVNPLTLRSPKGRSRAL